VCGLELAALLVATSILGVAIGLFAVAAWRRRPGGAVRLAIGLAAAVAVPVLLLAGGSALALLPFRVHARELAASALVTALAIGLAASLGRPGEGPATRPPARPSAGGAPAPPVPRLPRQ